MAVGDSTDILRRVKSLIPNRWFAWNAPNRDAVLGGLSDLGAWSYNWLIYTRQQSRIATATGPWLDIIAYDFLGRHLVRAGLDDATFATLIQATILQERVTRAGMIDIITDLTGNPPTIFEPWNTGDAGGYNTPGFAYGVAGGWGSIQLPGQTFIVVTRSAPSGVPNVVGYSGGGNYFGIGGYGVGKIAYDGPSVAQGGLTDAMIYAAIEATKPTGVICWTQFGGPLPVPPPAAPPPVTNVASIIIPAGTTQFIVPSNFYSLVSIEAIGQGARGSATAGGGGGAYAAIFEMQGLAVGNGYNVQIGGPTSGFPDTLFDSVLLAKGATGQLGGFDGGYSIGTTTYAGGNGAMNGGGGGAGGADGPGLSAISSSGGAGDFGYGGLGGISGAAGLPGFDLGGGAAGVGAGGGGGYGGKKGGAYGGGGSAINGPSSDGVIVFTYNHT